MSETNKHSNSPAIETSIAPWLSVRNSVKAVEFYKLAFGAIETYRLELGETEVVAKLSIDGAGFWVSEESPDSLSPADFGGVPVRMILTVTDPDTAFTRAIDAGATIIFPVDEGHGWRIGRLKDPFGHHWEIGRPI